jgi:benzoyl-CoA reductase/2-hydroxyglutaryl-CoA dehydratase subunit BcrC/BadD/HgdB
MQHFIEPLCTCARSTLGVLVQDTLEYSSTFMIHCSIAQSIEKYKYSAMYRTHLYFFVLSSFPQKA